MQSGESLRDELLAEVETMAPILTPRLAHPSITEGQQDPTSGRSTAAGGLAQIGRFRRFAAGD